ncbi:MAG: RND family transporter, partial [Planctomycetaceae bacterium]|nr:RND family transporter [Planctomycetaceae bacterium]
MKQLLRIRNLLLLAAITLTCSAAPFAARLAFDQSIESFFAPDNEDIRLLKRSRADFGGDEFVIVAWKQPKLIVRDEDREVPEISEPAAERISSLVEELNRVPGIAAEQTRHLVRYFDRAPRSRNTREAMLKMFSGILIGADEETTAVIVQLLPEVSSPVTRGATLKEIRRIAGEFDPTAAVAGEPVQIFDMFDLVERD